MTLVVAVNGPETIWLLADRRLTYPKPRGPRDDAEKVMIFEATDGPALIGYAGLGATIAGTQPAHWMRAVLRGRGLLTVEQGLACLAAAAYRELPRHISGLPIPEPEHDFVATAFVDNSVRLYSINLTIGVDGKLKKFAVEQHRDQRYGIPPRIAIAGHPIPYLAKYRSWEREVYRLVRASDELRVSPVTVADRLAALNLHVHEVDPTVGPRCVVVWRYPRNGRGGGHRYYTGVDVERNSPMLPMVGIGRDMTAVVGVLFNALQRARGAAPDWNAVNAEVAALPNHPDEKLR